MITIRPLLSFEPTDLQRLITGYVTQERYAVSWQETATSVLFALERTQLEQPYTHTYDPVDEETMERYRQICGLGYSWGAYAGELLVGLALAEPHWWNRSLWVWEFHVAQSHRRQGFGRGLMAQLAEQATAARLRTIVCETQTTNAPAIHFYRQIGFRVEGIDLSYYSNSDFPSGEVAIFMKRRL